MATTLQPPAVKLPSGASLRGVQERGPEASRTGIWVALAAISMSFAAFTSAMLVRQGTSNDWRHFAFPSILYLNTLALILSSFTLAVSRRRFAAFAAGIAESATPALNALYGTLTFGCLFVAGQYAAWLRLRSEGLYLATNPSSSFFYVFTAIHGLHVIGGLTGLVYVIRKLRRTTLRRCTLDAASHYWHFMDLLWLYLMFLLWLKL
jgi:cytochrome c oxidase subunit 3